MNYWIIPCQKKIKLFAGNPHDALRERPAFVSFDIKHQSIRISKAGVTMMDLNVGKRFHFIAMDEKIYCSLAHEYGNKLIRASRGDMHTKNAGFLDYVKKYFGAYNSFRCDIQKTNCEFNGHALWELIMPYRYKRSYFINKYKQ